MTRDRGPRPSPGSAATSLLTRGHAFIRVFHSDSWLQEVSRPQARGEPPRRAPALQARCGDVVAPATSLRRRGAPCHPSRVSGAGPRAPWSTCSARPALCAGRGVPPPAPAPDAPLSSAGYAPSDMPVKAKRSTYNYSLPITVKKTRTCLGPLRAGAAGLAPTPRAAGGRAAPRGATRALLASVPPGGDEAGRREGPSVFQGAALSRTASQLVSMHDLKQGLGPPGTAGTRKSASNKYKLKVGVPRVPGERPPTGLSEAWGAPPSHGAGTRTAPTGPLLCDSQRGSARGRSAHQSLRVTPTSRQLRKQREVGVRSTQGCGQ